MKMKAGCSALILSFLFLIVSTPSFAFWQSVGGSLNYNTTHDADTPKVAFDGNTPYIAFAENGVIWVKVYNGTDWEFVGNSLNAAGSSSSLPDITVDNGTPYVTWTESQEVYVSKFNGTSWEQIGTETDSWNTLTEDSSIAVYNGTPYVVQEEYDGIDTWEIIQRHYNGTSWTSLSPGSLNMSGRHARKPKIVFNGSTPYVTWYQLNGSSRNQIYVRRWNSGTSQWDHISAPSLNEDSSKSAYRSEIAFNGSTPYVTWYEDASPQDLVYVKALGASWNLVGSFVNTLSTVQGQYPVIECNGNTPYVVYLERPGSYNQAKVKYFNGSSWVQMGTNLNESASRHAESPRIRFSSNGIPYVVWEEDDSLSNKNIYVKKYVYATLTYTPTMTATPVVTATPTVTPTDSATSTHSPTPSYTATITPSSTVSPTPSFTATASPTSTPSPTPTHSATYTVSPTATFTSTASPSPTISATSTVTGTSTITATVTTTIVFEYTEDVISYPNPAKEQMKFAVKLDKPGEVVLHIYNMSGEKISELSQTMEESGQLLWNCNNVSAGVYLVRIMKDGSEIKKIKVAVVK